MSEIPTNSLDNQFSTTPKAHFRNFTTKEQRKRSDAKDYVFNSLNQSVNPVCRGGFNSPLHIGFTIILPKKIRLKSV